jgi:cell division septum initiation protein DivIVA
MNASKLPPERPGSDPVSEAAERLAEIVRAAERAAASVIDDAEEQARNRVEEAQARADRIVAERLRAIADEIDPPSDSAARPRLRTVEPVSEPETSEPNRRPGEAGARLLATQMAVSGASRAEIENRLRTGAGIEDPSGLLDAILGPEE